MRRFLAAVLCACTLASLSGCAAMGRHAMRPERLTREPVSREMVELVRAVRAKS